MGFNLKSSAINALAPSKRVSLFFKTLKPGIGFSAMNVLDGLLFQHKAVSSMLIIYCLV